MKHPYGALRRRIHSVSMPSLRSAFRPAVIACLVGLLGPSVASAQTTDPIPPAVAPPRISRIWVSGGLGPAGFYRTGGLGYRASANLSVDRLVLTFRKAGAIESFDGHRHLLGTSVLGGYRLGGKYLYMIPALGFGTASFEDDLCTNHIQCTPDVAAQYQDDGPVVAYDVGFHANWFVAGLSVNLTGAAGSPKRNFTALVFSFSLGWFGQ